MFGVVLIAVVWLLLTELAAPVSAAILRHNVGAWASQDDLTQRLDAATPDARTRVVVENALLQMVVLAAACFLVGLVVGRWSPRRGVREAAFAGAGAAAIAVVAASASGELGATERSLVIAFGFLAVVPCASLAAAVGARRGALRKGVLPQS